MTLQRMFGAMSVGLLVVSAPPALQAQTETLAATATVKTAAGSTATAPLTLKIERKMSQAEADTLTAAFREGGAAGLRKALQGVAPTGTVTLGAGPATPTRLTIERTVEKGRLLTVVTDTPLFFVGASVPGAKPKAGHDFAVLDLQVDAKGGGSGTLAPAAKIAVKGGAFVVEDYGSELVRLTAVKTVK